MDYKDRADEQTKKAIEEFGKTYDKQLLAIKLLKVLCNKGVLPSDIKEKLILREIKIIKGE